ncbi:MAG: ACP S-malonyltransferase [Flavobacteriaceae bacterium]
MKVAVFPGQGAQFEGMGKDLYEAYPTAKKRFEQANELLGFDIAQVMFEGSKEDLLQTQVTQPAIFLHSVVLAEVLGEKINVQAVAGHSLGEFSALTYSGAMSFESGLLLVHQRALAMQAACEKTDGTMAAVLGLKNEVVASLCEKTAGIVVAANYNCPGQLVISGDKQAVANACERLKEAGARRALVLPVGGAFHSPLMESARLQLAEAIAETPFQAPRIPIYQNVTAQAATDVEDIQTNLIKQLTGSVKWTQSVAQMCQDGATSFVEIGPGNVLQGLIKKINRSAQTASGQSLL